ncbi:MAG: hypothetical protein CFE43_21070 [Burkholderiales bacterium PBB3]|nr:MAG: hypothetical protein CFE43_21070 [Burkholderiales bacterium PBB3]
MRLMLVALIISLGSAANSQIAYPPSAAGNQSTTLHEVSVPDPYQWMEKLDSSLVRDWRDSQHALTMKYLEKSEGRRASIRAIASRLTLSLPMRVPDVHNGTEVWLAAAPGEGQASLRSRRAGELKENIIYDPNKEAPDGSLSVANFWVSKDGEMTTFQVRVKGTQQFLMYVKSTTNDKTFYEMPKPPKTPLVSRVGWLNGHESFYYVREVDAETLAASKTPKSPFLIYHHVVGTDPKSDSLVYSDDSTPARRYSCMTSDDGKWLILNVWEKRGVQNGLMFMPLKNGIADTSKKILIGEDFAATNRLLDVKDGHALILTNKGAPNFKVVSLDLTSTGSPSSKDVLSERASAIEHIVAVNGKLAVSYITDGSHEAYIFSNEGAVLSKVQLPGVGSVGAWAGDANGSRVLFTFSSMVSPVALYALDIDSGKVAIYKSALIPFDSSKYEVVKEFVQARDGTKLAVLIARKKNTINDGKSHLLLEGYGGFGVSLNSYFSAATAAWLDMGGVYANALIRGGGEYGANWRKGGTMLNKKNSFHDFVDIAQYLVDKKFTSSDRLGIIGESNGGLLVAAAVNERPKLFAAAASMVGITDMIRLETSKIPFDWTDEYGTVKNVDDFRNLLSYSPIHNIARDVEYPAVLVISSELDDRVLPWHQFKYTAALQNSNLGAKPKLLRISYGAGHAYGKTLQMQIEETTDTLTFIANATGLFD